MTADKIFKTLGNSIRLRLLCLLRERDWRVGDLQAITGLPMAMVSKDLMRMRAQKLVAATRRGVSITYTLPPGPETEILRGILAAAQSILPPEALADAETVKSYVPSEMPQTEAESRAFVGNGSRGSKRPGKPEKAPVPTAQKASESDHFGTLPTNLL